MKRLYSFLPYLNWLQLQNSTYFKKKIQMTIEESNNTVYLYISKQRTVEILVLFFIQRYLLSTNCPIRPSQIVPLCSQVLDMSEISHRGPQRTATSGGWTCSGRPFPVPGCAPCACARRACRAAWTVCRNPRRRRGRPAGFPREWSLTGIFKFSVPDPGSGAFLTSKSGIGFSRIPNPYFWELGDNSLGKK